MDPLALGIGQALRAARKAQGLTLHGVSDLSGGEFKATSVAGYERGERAITLERFCRLCDLYGVLPDRLLADVVRDAETRGDVQVDLTALESLGAAEGSLVGGFIRQVMSRRREPERSAIALRAGDLEVLATASGKKPEELLEILRPVIRDNGEPDEIDPIGRAPGEASGSTGPDIRSP